jgi:hypothetical protein
MRYAETGRVASRVSQRCFASLINQVGDKGEHRFPATSEIRRERHWHFSPHDTAAAVRRVC